MWSLVLVDCHCLLQHPSFSSQESLHSLWALTICCTKEICSESSNILLLSNRTYKSLPHMDSMRSRTNNTALLQHFISSLFWLHSGSLNQRWKSGCPCIRNLARPGLTGAKGRPESRGECGLWAGFGRVDQGIKKKRGSRAHRASPEAKIGQAC